MRGHTSALTLSLLLFSATAAGAQDWCKSKWGADDEKGAANHLTPQLALEAAKLVKTGKVYQLGVETNSKTPAYPPRTFGVTILHPGQTGGSSLGPTKTMYNDDIITGWVGVGIARSHEDVGSLAAHLPSRRPVVDASCRPEAALSRSGMRGTPSNTQQHYRPHYEER